MLCFCTGHPGKQVEFSTKSSSGQDELGCGCSPGGFRCPGTEPGGDVGAVKQQRLLLVGVGKNAVSTGLHLSDCGSILKPSLARLWGCCWVRL